MSGDMLHTAKRKMGEAAKDSRARKRSRGAQDGSAVIDAIPDHEDAGNGLKPFAHKAIENDNTEPKSITGTNLSRGQRPRISDHEASKHLRFGSEDSDSGSDIDGPSPPDDQSSGQPKPGSDEQSDEESDDDDDAPEDVQTVYAKKEVKDAATAVARAVEQERVARRRKRKDLDARLKIQAKSQSKSRKKAGVKANTEARSLESDDEDPDFLPEELLAETFKVAPSPPLDSTRPRLKPEEPPQENKKKKNLGHQLEHTVRDVKVGPVTVRVLDRSNPFLAPKAVPQSRDRREAWLRGRPGRKGVGAFERKPVNAGFVRK